MTYEPATRRLQRYGSPGPLQMTCHACGAPIGPRIGVGRLRRRCDGCSIYQVRLAQRGLTQPPVPTTCRTCGIDLGPRGLRGPQKLYCSRACQPGHRYGATPNSLARARRQVSRATRAVVLERDDWTCYLCSRPIDPTLAAPHPGSASIDHVVPVSMGGGDTTSNLASTHLRCNLEKGANPPQWWQAAPVAAIGFEASRG